MIRHVLSVKLIFFDFPSDIGPTFCGMGEKHSRQPRLLFEKRESPVRFQSNVKRGGVVGDGVVGDGVVGDGVVGNGVVFWAK